MKMKERYQRNMAAFSEQELASIFSKKVCVVGCGGLGGYVCHTLARFGVGHITVVDGDIFNPSNLNRQLFALESTLGKNKAQVCKEKIADINPEVTINAKPVMLTKENSLSILAGHDVIVDCLDTVAARFLLQDACNELGIPWVHGAIGGFYGQVATIYPHDGMLEILYQSGKDTENGLEKKLGNPAFTPQLVASLQCSEVIKLLAERKNILKGKILYIDLLENSFDCIDLL